MRGERLARPSHAFSDCELAFIRVHLRLMQDRSASSELPLDQQSLGDTPPDEFRRQLHTLADWIADYREKI